MKNIVVFDEYKDADLKPSDLLRKYVALAERDVKSFLSKKGQLKACACPACGVKKTSNTFKKSNLTYNECVNCHSLYVSPRPSDEKLDAHYRSSPSAVFWREQLSQKAKDKRKEKIIKPRFQWILESTSEYYPEAVHYADVNTNQVGYIEELHKAGQFKKKTIIHPFLPADTLRFDSEIDVIDAPWWELKAKGAMDVISLFEVCDKTADVRGLLKKVHEALSPRGLLFITSILASGFDLQVLGKSAENLYPPDRLNVFSIEAFKWLLLQNGFEILELSTPGILDVALVEKAMAENPKLQVPAFVDYFLKHRDEEAKKNFQEFLQSNLLSSYGRILARKR